MQVEYTAFEPPNRLAPRTSSPVMATNGEVICCADGNGTLLGWDWQDRLTGALRVGGPVFTLLAGRCERRNWLRLRYRLEDRSQG